ncbi:MAG: glycosyltransferase [Roseomonas sp.]|nr:glycosyltransferase [Roseomonas sp.]
MPRVVFALPFRSNVVSGGQKMIYQAACMLARHGVDAVVWQRHGRPTWFESDAPHCHDRPPLGANDLVVLPEDVPASAALELLEGVTPRRILFCQNPFHYLRKRFADPASFVWDGVMTVGAGSARLVRRVSGSASTHLVQVSVNGAIFCPGVKRLRICTVPRKLPSEYEVIIAGFRHLYPQFASIPVARIENMPENAVAETMAGSAVFLSLSHRESFGLTPIEAMASGCAVVGYHGWGGLDYANAANGRWFGHDELEGVIDALAEVLEGLRQNDPLIASMIAAGRETAAAYAPAKSEASLLAAFRAFGAL